MNKHYLFNKKNKKYEFQKYFVLFDFLFRNNNNAIM